MIEAERGRVDTNASVRYGNVTSVAQDHPSPRLHLFVRAGFFDENRKNGKSSTIDGTPEANDTIWRSASGGMRQVLPDASELSATVYGDSETFHSNFLAVPAAVPPRSVGRMTLRQTVPVLGTGATVRWSRTLGTAHLFTAGLDTRWVRGDSEEDALDPVRGTQVTLHRVSGGRQRGTGILLQDLVQASSRLVLTLGARVDHWSNYDGHNVEECAPNVSCVPNNIPSLPDRAETSFSPRIGALYRVHPRLSVWGSGSGAFRAPTLNELYRQFRVGTVLTLANSALIAERLRGYETGATLTAGRGVTLRTTWFDDAIRDPVSNVTIATAGANVTQQRQNLGSTRVRGLEADADWRTGTHWRLAAAYAHMSARVTENECGTGDRRQHAAAGAVASRVVPGVLHVGTLRHVRGAGHRHGRAVRRRPQHAGTPPARLRHARSDRLARDLARPQPVRRRAERLRQGVPGRHAAHHYRRSPLHHRRHHHPQPAAVATDPPRGHGLHGYPGKPRITRNTRIHRGKATDYTDATDQRNQKESTIRAVAGCCDSQ